MSKTQVDEKQRQYNRKCRFVCFRFRKDIDKKYLDFLDSCENKTSFLRNAIDRELNKTQDML